MNDRKDLLTKIQICDFILNDTALFLDTHPTDAAALAYFTQYQEYKNNFSAEYSAKFGPLMRGDYDGGPVWQWTNMPWPWQNEEA